MKQNLPFRISLATTVVASLLFCASCKKDATDNSGPTDTDAAYVTDQVQLEKAFDDVQDIADQASMDGDMSNYRTTSACATITYDTVSATRKITIDFGSTDCLCGDGVYRRGKIIMTFTGRYRDSGYVHVLTFDGYYFNDNQLTGSRTVRNKGKNSSGQIYFSVDVGGAIILDKSAGTKKWTSSRTRTWTAGESTKTHIDDTYSITGSGTVTRVDGSTFTGTITSQLILSASCDWISQGTIEIVPSGSGKTRILDYGSGTCDAVATLTVGGKSRTVTLHR